MMPSTMSASVTVGSEPPVPYAAGRGIAAALLGPTRRFPPRSIHAIAPPPDPIASTLIVGTLIGCRLMMVFEERTGSPSMIRPTGT